MKLRRHKNTRTFHIVFGPRDRPKNQILDHVFAKGNSVGEVRRGFLAGRDRNNTVFNIAPA